MKHLWAVLFIITIGVIDILIDRTEFIFLFSLYTMAFGLLIYFYRSTDDHHNVLYFVALGLVARFVSIVGFPNLSDDIYRFYWDGYLCSTGQNPFLRLPSELNHTEIISDYMKESIYPHLNSKDYFAIYPPFAQLVYGLAVKISGDSLYAFNWIVGIIILFAEAGTLYVALKLLPLLGFPQKNILLYSLNPLVILESCGNLHFEPVMVFFFLMAVWTLHRKRYFRFGYFFVLSILSKLFTTVFYPLFCRRLGWKKFILLSIMISIGLVIGFAPFLSTAMIERMGSSLDLYVRHFEFNASIYYLLREVGYWIKGYNMIAFIGPLLASAFFIFLGMMYAVQYINDRGILLRSLFIFSVYLLLSPIVHPWYIILLVSLCLFTRYIYPWVWSYLVFLSYSAYMTPVYKENMALLMIEYAILLVVILMDFRVIPIPSFLKSWFNTTTNHSHN